MVLCTTIFKVYESVRCNFFWFSQQKKKLHKSVHFKQSYVIKSAPWTILWFRILEIFPVENIKRVCVFMFQTCSNSQLLRRVLWISAEQAIGASLKHKNSQPLYMFNRVRVPHLNSLKERTWLHSFGFSGVLEKMYVILCFYLVQASWQPWLAG